MNMKMYSVFDNKIDEFVTPFFAESDKQAMRMIQNSLGSQSQLVLYPADYELFCLAEFNSGDGQLTGVNKHSVSKVIKLIPIGLRKFALDGSFGGVSDETQED